MVVEDLSSLPEFSRWRDLCSIAMIEAERHVDATISPEVCFCITFLQGDAQQVAHPGRAQGAARDYR